MKHEELVRRIRETGFSCTRCGSCCRGTPDDMNLVMVSPEEIDGIREKTGHDPVFFTEPYPESVSTGSGGSITFERCLRRNPDACLFLSGGSCTVYESRPWICRTFPFMLAEGKLLVSACEGLGQEIDEDHASHLARELVARNDKEREEEEKVRQILAAGNIPDGKAVLIDGRGLTVI